MTTITVSGNTGSTVGGIEDTELDQFSPTTNQSANTQAYIDSWASPDFIVTMFLKIPIPSGEGAVSNTKLRLFLKDRNYAKSDLSVYEILRDDALPSQATAEEYKTGSAWTEVCAQGSGTDRSASALASTDIGSTAPGVYIEWTGSGLDSLVQDAIDNSLTFILLNVQFTDLVPSAQSYVRFATSEGTDGEMPELVYDLTVTDQDISPPLLVSQETIYAPTVSVGSVSLQVPLLESSPEIIAPTISVGAVSLEVPLLESSSQILEPEISSFYTISVPLLNNDQQIYEPSVSVGSLTLSVPLLNSEAVIYAPSLLDGLVLEVPLLSNEQEFFPVELIRCSVPPNGGKFKGIQENAGSRPKNGNSVSRPEEQFKQRN